MTSFLKKYKCIAVSWWCTERDVGTGGAGGPWPLQSFPESIYWWLVYHLTSENIIALAPPNILTFRRPCCIQKMSHVAREERRPRILNCLNPINHSIFFLPLVTAGGGHHPPYGKNNEFLYFQSFVKYMKKRYKLVNIIIFKIYMY